MIRFEFLTSFNIFCNFILTYACFLVNIFHIFSVFKLFYCKNGLLTVLMELFENFPENDATRRTRSKEQPMLSLWGTCRRQ